jgi:hypothetical protein
MAVYDLVERLPVREFHPCNCASFAVLTRILNCKKNVKNAYLVPIQPSNRCKLS